MICGSLKIKKLLNHDKETCECDREYIAEPFTSGKGKQMLISEKKHLDISHVTDRQVPPTLTK